MMPSSTAPSARFWWTSADVDIRSADERLRRGSSGDRVWDLIAPPAQQVLGILNPTLAVSSCLVLVTTPLVADGLPPCRILISSPEPVRCQARHPGNADELPLTLVGSAGSESGAGGTSSGTYPSRTENAFLMRCPPTLEETAPLKSFPLAARGVRYTQIALPNRARGVPFSLTRPIEAVQLTDVGVTGSPSVFT